MKKLIFLILIIFSLIPPIGAAEIKDCSNIKKLSKMYLTCKSENFKIGIIKTGSKVKQGTISKAKNFKSSINNPFKKKDKK
tara:strand:- start:395 stop:637 length:243 start_codon:yes stop_codon:yes gene_type:complete